MKLDQNLSHYIKLRGLTLSSLARLSGVKQPTLHGWSTGRAVKNIEDLKKVCQVLEVSLHTMLFGEKDPYESSLSVQEFLQGDIRIIIEKINR